MARKCIVIGLPTFGLVSMRWAIAYAMLRMPMNAITPRIIKWGLEVSLARNEIVADTLRDDPDASHIFFLDDDVLVHPCCLVQLLQAGKDIVSGVYYHKDEVAEPLIFGPPGAGTVAYDPRRGLVGPPEVFTVPAGVLLVRTQVFREMAERLDLGLDARGNPRWFHTSGNQSDEEPMTEDAYFCSMAHAAGIERWVDMDYHAFAWHLNINKQRGYPSKQWQEYVSTGSMTWDNLPDSLFPATEAT